MDDGDASAHSLLETGVLDGHAFTIHGGDEFSVTAGVHKACVGGGLS